MKKPVLLVLATVTIVSATAFSLPVSTVLGGTTNFDPWNQTRWAAWYSSGKLVKTFEIDCNVVLMDRGGSSSPWEPDVSSHENGRIFTFGNSGRGVTFDGNGQFIDIRKTKPSLSTLYSVWWLYSDSNRHPLEQCFRVSQTYSASAGPTVIRNVWMKGFGRGIRVLRTASPNHPLTIQDCQFRRNNWGVYLSGTNTTVTSCGIKENAKGAIYSGAAAYGNTIINNAFKDNDYEQTARRYYGDIAMDTAHYTLVENNTFETPTGGSYHIGVQMYRNMGESGDLREHATHSNILRGNTFNGYSAAFHVGSRQGHEIDYDLSQEGRDYANYNIFEDNTINNTTIGLAVNCSGNTIRGNTFNNVTRPIVLNCVYYALTETTINDQAGDNVYYWFKSSDFSSYSSWFPNQSQLNSGIAESSKLIHIRSDYGQPNFPTYTGPATVVIAPSLMVDANNRVPDLSGDQFINLRDIAHIARFWQDTDCGPDNDFCAQADINYDGAVDLDDLALAAEDWLLGNTMADVLATGVLPIDIAVGHFWAEVPGDQIAVIWNTPVSNIKGTNYYSIIIYDCRGIEINRCGKSTTQWAAITAGNFLNIVGTYSVLEAGDEIAAVKVSATGGYYPVYVFGRGREVPSATLLTTNTSKIIDLAAGNFKTTGDTLDEIAVIFEGGSTIAFCKPSEPTWTATTTGAVGITQIAAANFDRNTSNGDEIAGIGSAGSTVFFFRVNATGPYTTAASAAGLPNWTAITGGDFVGVTNFPAVAVASATRDEGVYNIYYFTPHSPTPFKISSQDVLGVPVRALSVGRPVISVTPGPYERVQGFYAPDYNAAISGWGDHVVVLPVAAQTTGIPVFWINSNTFNHQEEYLKVTPIFR